MTNRMVTVVGLLALLGLSESAHAQGIVGGARVGAARGERAAGPVGGIVGSVVGGAVGGVVGGARGVLGLPRRSVHAARPARHRHR
ncbi:MAG: hypothetical protein ACRYF1_19335 [Janthinobacterium lividum]